MQKGNKTNTPLENTIQKERKKKKEKKRKERKRKKEMKGRQTKRDIYRKVRETLKTAPTERKTKTREIPPRENKMRKN